MGDYSGAKMAAGGPTQAGVAWSVSARGQTELEHDQEDGQIVFAVKIT